MPVEVRGGLCNNLQVSLQVSVCHRLFNTCRSRHPDDLYKNGIQRSSFIPCIDLIKSRFDVTDLDSGTGEPNCGGQATGWGASDRVGCGWKARAQVAAVVQWHAMGPGTHRCGWGRVGWGRGH